MQPTAALAAPALLRHARRALLLLGAAFVWWLLFTGGPAHADDSGQQASGPALAPDLQHATGDLVDQTTAATSRTLRAAPGHVTRTLTEATRTAPEPVRTTVESLSTALSPTLSATTTAVADTVDRTVQTTRPVLDVVAPATASTSTTDAVARPVQHRQVRLHQHRADAPVASARAVLADAHAAHAAAASLGSVHGGVPGTPTAPASPWAPVAPGGPDTTPTGPMAALGGLFLAVPASRRLRRRYDGSDRLLDPVYPPGCSPD